MQYFFTLGMLGIMLNAIPACENTMKGDLISMDSLELTEQEQQKIKADNQFTLNLFEQTLTTLEQDENIMVSPLSVSMSVGMTANGAEGATRDAIYKTLQYEGYAQDFINQYYQKIIYALPNLDPEVQVDIANSIWYKDDFKVVPRFLKTNATYYQATAEALNFSDPKSVEIINAWVDKKTQGKIPTIIDNIPGDLRMMLINALYFKGAWKTPFKKEATRSDQFTAPSGAVQTAFMHRQGSMPVWVNDQLRAVELPYGEHKTYSMLAVLPNPGVSPAEVLKSLNETPLSDAEFTPRMVSLDLPKFKFAYEQTLNDALSALGLQPAMNDRADFTGISAQGGLRISEVKHKTFIEVNEEGTEAAAVTSTGISVTSMPQYFEMRFDHPFLFFIKENKTGLILFSGLVHNPAK